MTDKVHKYLNRGGFLGIITAIISIVASANGWIGNSAVQAQNVSDLMDFKTAQQMVNSQIFSDVSAMKNGLTEISTNLKWLMKEGNK